jgi:hypothetical protein
MKRFCTSLVALAFWPAVAFAWNATVEGPDVFGVTKVIASEGNQRELLVVQCDSKDALHIAYIFAKKEFEDLPTAPATLLVQANGDEPHKLDATLRVWNDNYGGVVASGRDADLLAVLKKIGAAKGKVNVGYEAKGHQWSASFSSRGSTKAIERVIEGCKLSGAMP